jgi:hypothetical protein
VTSEAQADTTEQKPSIAPERGVDNSTSGGKEMKRIAEHFTGTQIKVALVTENNIDAAKPDIHKETGRKPTLSVQGNVGIAQ